MFDLVLLLTSIVACLLDHLEDRVVDRYTGVWAALIQKKETVWRDDVGIRHDGDGRDLRSCEH